MTQGTLNPPASGESSPGVVAPRAVARDIRRILKLSVPVTVVLAERDMTIEAILQLTVGSIVEFDVAFDAELILHVAGRPVGSGQAVKSGENFGLRISTVGSVRERIDALAGD